MSKGKQKIADWERQNSRALAVRTLEQVKNGAYSNLQLNQIIKDSQLDQRDVNLLTTLVYGVIQHRLTLEYWLQPFTNGKADSFVQELLLVSIFQMQYLDKVPNHAIFDEAIQIAKRRGHDGIRKYVTGVLHAIDRQGFPTMDAIKDPVERLSIEASIPVWIIQQLKQEVGFKKTQSIAMSLNQAPRQTVRVNRAVTDAKTAIASLEEEGFVVSPSLVSADALVVEYGHVASSKAALDGLVTVQDEAATLMVPNLQLQPNAYVLDAAAAPGGKTTQIATYLDSKQGGRVEALDIHPHKVRLIQENAQRLHVDAQIVAQQLDARNVAERFTDASFDAILVDAPCSGFGLMRRKPEIRYEKQYQDSQNLHKIQLAILEAVAPKLKPQGRLVYGTCTIFEIENDAVVQAFLSKHPDFELVKTKGALASETQISGQTELTQQIYPDDYGSDGFFIATLRKKQ
ncbi:16S rRNA (cytosine(967)-C(5))-methyltransferase RsmB [Weissella kandleri]|uniref:16S rRNA (cytosine(967)-C(5))-methyltransferase RsmB n=1 Tax=Weissella kandleri TaxID=1616 RepID=UPI00387ED88A